MGGIHRLVMVWLSLALVAPSLSAYPLNGAKRSGIRRLDGYLAAQTRKTGLKLPPGALLGLDDLQLSLATVGSDWDLAAANHDPALQASLESIFKPRDPSYGVVVIDVTDPAKIAWAGIRDGHSQYPGSVGKVLCMAAVFDGLRRAFPEIADRERLLRDRMIDATDWAVGDPHTVPKFDAGTGFNRFATITATDRFSLAEWIDHAISPSANGAGAIIWREAMLLRQFGANYPPSREEEAKFMRETPRAELTKLSLTVINDPLTAAGIDLEKIQQGTFWTKASQRRIPGVASFATPRELARVLLRIEQGRLVDAWSSLEMKRFLYMTKKRYRYAYPPELANAAVYFKSGSLYQCLKGPPEPDFKCGKYRGNGKNYMNSIAIVESPAARDDGQRRYIVALISNVLRTNSAWDHARLGAAIDRAVHTRGAVVVDERAGTGAVHDAGQSD